MGSSMAPSRRRLVTGPRESELGFLPERFAKALVDPQGMEGGTPTNLSTPGPKRVGRLPAAATQCGAVLGLTRNSGRHAPAIIHVCTPEVVGACRPLPHHAEPFSDSPATVGARRQARIPDEGRFLAASTPRGAILRLAHDSGRGAPASV